MWDGAGQETWGWEPMGLGGFAVPAVPMLLVGRAEAKQGTQNKLKRLFSFFLPQQKNLPKQMENHQQVPKADAPLQPPETPGTGTSPLAQGLPT